MNPLKRFKEFNVYVKKQTSKHVKAVRLDHRDKYMSYEFAKFLKENGIVSQLTPPSTS